MLLKSTRFKFFAKIMGENYYSFFFVQVILALTLQPTLGYEFHKNCIDI